MDDASPELLHETRLASSINKIRASGGRLTRARLAILKSIVDATDHVTAETLFTMVSTNNPYLHISTVYRTLESLEDIGVVEHMHLGHGSATYHLSDDVHQHLVCENCGITLEAPVALTRELEKGLESTLGFHTRAHHFSIIGLCKNCYKT